MFILFKIWSKKIKAQKKITTKEKSRNTIKKRSTYAKIAHMGNKGKQTYNTKYDNQRNECII